MTNNTEVTEAMIEAGVKAVQDKMLYDAEAVTEIYLAMQSERLKGDGEVIEKLRALRVMCESCNQPLYVAILDEALEELSPPPDGVSR